MDTKMTLLSIAFAMILNSIIPVESIKCFICDYNINYCKTPHCYNNYDVCSANQFASVYVPIQECPRNCMLKAVTNPAGIVLKWKRLCAPRDDLTRGFNCRIDYVFGARIEQCTCDKDFCNSSPDLRKVNLVYNYLLPFEILITFIIIYMGFE